MNVLWGLMIVIPKQHVKIHLEVILAYVMQDIQEMEKIVQVIQLLS